jgi:hypothetical protein
MHEVAAGPAVDGGEGGKMISPDKNRQIPTRARFAAQFTHAKNASIRRCGAKAGGKMRSGGREERKIGTIAFNYARKSFATLDLRPGLSAHHRSDLRETVHRWQDPFSKPYKFARDGVRSFLRLALHRSKHQTHQSCPN